MEFIEAPWFSRRLEQLARADALDVLAALQNDLLANVLRGRLVPDLDGVRKARAGNPLRAKGKRGGYRYFYLYIEHKGHVHLLLLLDKNEQEDLTAAERGALRKLVAEIKGSGGAHAKA